MLNNWNTGKRLKNLCVYDFFSFIYSFEKWNDRNTPEAIPMLIVQTRNRVHSYRCPRNHRPPIRCVQGGVYGLIVIHWPLERGITLLIIIGHCDFELCAGDICSVFNLPLFSYLFLLLFKFIRYIIHVKYSSTHSKYDARILKSIHIFFFFG